MRAWRIAERQAARGQSHNRTTYLHSTVMMKNSREAVKRCARAVSIDLPRLQTGCSTRARAVASPRGRGARAARAGSQLA